ncbi:uncharacterized protein LOC125233780 [Leguminivora glycinivorella]|uniref:uncharacterized protein LOC125228587 n=1 Tax=Leguminivora glycinivorella TaxID=1035111 RepID=UPI00200EB129|nr:uncharacterized protein LOC125228587 [Leguminivora glycinivorella]XP_047995835.1 uncharacterized protein LOC125233780 [Leguminivora glycinivorella]
MSDSECSVYTRTPSPEPKKIATKNIKKRKSSSAARSEVETENRRVLHSSSPTPCAQKKKTTKKARTSTSENKNVGSSSSKKSPETDIFKIIREEEKITSEGSSKTVKTTSSFTSRVSTGSSRRTTITDGNFFIDLKVYNINDYQKSEPEERYKKALASVKLQCQENSSEWNQIQTFLGQAFNIFGECEPVYYNNYKKN